MVRPALVLAGKMPYGAGLRRHVGAQAIDERACRTTLTQNQLTELLESEGAKSLIETAEERGYIEPAELEAFALEHELVDVDVEELTRELERIGLEVREAPVEEKAVKAE